MDIYNLGLHVFKQLDESTQVMRVPGGWTYTFNNGQTGVFVPFDNGFQKMPDTKDVNLQGAIHQLDEDNNLKGVNKSAWELIRKEYLESEKAPPNKQSMLCSQFAKGTYCVYYRNEKCPNEACTVTTTRHT